MKEDLKFVIDEAMKGEFWNQYFKPTFENEIEKIKESLIDCSEEQVKELQIRAKCLRYVLAKPKQEYLEE